MEVGAGGGGQHRHVQVDVGLLLGPGGQGIDGLAGEVPRGKKLNKRNVTGRGNGAARIERVVDVPAGDGEEATRVPDFSASSFSCGITGSQLM